MAWLLASLVVLLGAAGALFLASHLVPSLLGKHPSQIVSLPTAESPKQPTIGVDLTTFNVPVRFHQAVTLDKTFTVHGSAQLLGGVTTQDASIDAGQGSVTAANLLYGIGGGPGIAVSSGQHPIITNSGVLSVNGQQGAVALKAGTGVAIDGLTISSTVSFPSLIGVSGGGTGATSLTSNGVLYGNGTSPVSALAPGTTGFVLQSNGASAAPSWVAASGISAGNVPFSGITSGTNLIATMLVGSGASLGFTGTGTINASSLLGTTWATPGAIGLSTANTGAFTTLTTSGNVGIGTTNVASAALTVGGSQLLIGANATTARIGDYNSASGIWLRFSDGNSYYDSNANTFFRTNGGASIPLQLFSGGNAEVTNNLGIGNGTPSERLDVSGNATVSGNLTFSGGARTIAARAGNTLTIGDSQTGNVVLNQGGNVGIGTTTPIGKLEVDGSVVFKGPDPWLDVKAYGAKGDGVTDDTTAIQNALNQWSGTSGPGVIYFPKGTYKITSTLTFPYTQGKTMQGAGSYMSTIQQATDNIPIVSIPNENTHTIHIVDMGFAFKNQQTASNTNGYGFQFLSTTGGVSGMYHWVVERSRFANAYIGIGVTGSAGQVGIIWGSVFQTLYFDHTQHTAIRLVSPQTFGMNDNEFDNIKIINTGGAAITSDGAALEFSAVGARINNLDIEGWYNQILQNTGGFAVSITQLHIEHHIFTNAYAIMVYNANGSLQIKQAEIEATNQAITDTRLFVNTVNGELDLQDFTVNDTLSSGTVSFLQASAGAPVYLRNIKDAVSTTSIPALSSDTITLAQIKQFDNNFYNGVLFGIAADTNLYRSAASTLKTDGTLQVGAGFQQLGAGNSYFTGNVGIGVTNPVNKLGIAGGVAIGSYAGVNTAPTNGLIVSGNVGIGTTNPQGALDVASPMSYFGTPAGGARLSAAGTGAAAGAGIWLRFTDNNAYYDSAGGFN
ncbi:MAG: glycosyl hydrolase family 28-related protein, partial [Thermomicrobiales bacterium]